MRSHSVENRGHESGGNAMLQPRHIAVWQDFRRPRLGRGGSRAYMGGTPQLRTDLPFMISSLLFLAAGVALLTFAGDYLVRGAAGLAENLGIPALIVGLTVVAFGTSAPELFVSVQAALDGAPGIAIGNVVGSNIANILLVVGLPALITTVPTGQKGTRRSMTMMLGVTILFMLLIDDGTVSHADGIILVAVVIVFVVWQVREAIVAPRPGRAAASEIEEEVGERPHDPGRIALYLVGGLVGLPLGAELTVQGAMEIARSFGISEAVIGLTIVAIGTSLPEIATSFMAAKHGKHGVGIGNAVGSNIFNLACIMGITGLIIPVHVDPRIIHVDMWVMFAATVLLTAVAFAGVPLDRRLGIVAVLAYAAFIYSLF
jgi:cation:H+ antiporter